MAGLILVFELPVCCNLNLQRHLGIQEILVLTQVQCNFLLGGFQFQLEGLNSGLCVNNSQFMLSVCAHDVKHAQHFAQVQAGVIPRNTTASQWKR